MVLGEQSKDVVVDGELACAGWIRVRSARGVLGGVVGKCIEGGLRA